MSKKRDWIQETYRKHNLEGTPFYLFKVSIGAARKDSTWELRSEEYPYYISLVQGAREMSAIYNKAYKILVRGGYLFSPKYVLQWIRRWFIYHTREVIR